MIVTIDGPAGSGKSTTARAVARRLGYLYLDTGAMYRAVALAFLEKGAPVSPEASLRVLNGLKLTMSYDEEGELAVFLGNRDVSAAIRTEQVSVMASRVSTLEAVRRRMVEEQRRIARERNQQKGVVLEGRDTGTKVFPEADVKVFLVADVRERARRRMAQLEEQGETVAYEKVLEDLKARDAQDRERAISPLRKADDAVELDTTELSIDEQIDFIVDLVLERA